MSDQVSSFADKTDGEILELVQLARAELALSARAGIEMLPNSRKSIDEVLNEAKRRHLSTAS